jgi:hypothetical protein
MSIEPPIEVVDIMNSPCTNLFGEDGVPLGKKMQNIWDNAQKSGNVGELKRLGWGRGPVEVLFGRQCLVFMRDLLWNSAPHVAPHHGPPHRIIVTEPMMLAAITEAVKEVKKDGRYPLSTAHLYMTDLPGVGKFQATNFWNPLKSLKYWHPQRTRCLVVHSVPPISGNIQELVNATGLEASQIVMERFLPITAKFLPPYGHSMPRPGEAVQISLKAQLPEEHAFLGGDSKTFSIGAGDTVVLVMLGSQPTVAAIHAYFEQAKRLALPPMGKLRWVFFACGPHETPAFAQLYASIAASATAFNQQQESTNGRLRFVPFTGQPAQMLEGRAEVTVTRSGGMTAGELLALNARGDIRQVFIHFEAAPLQGPPPRQIDNATEWNNWEKIALKNGMVEWEAGNAEYLISKVGAQLLLPEMFATLANRRSVAAWYDKRQ